MTSTISGTYSPRHELYNYSDLFTVIIKSSNTAGNKGYTVTARLPQEIQLQLSSVWDSPFVQSTGNALVESLSNAVGVSSKLQYASAQIWSGSSPIEITLNLEFYAESDPAREVLQPIIQLSRMALPRLAGTKKGGLFSPPGPRIFTLDIDGQDTSGDKITIKIGKFMNFTNVIITDVSPVFSTKDMGRAGIPLKASCSITFRSMYTFTGAELEAALTGSSSE